MLNRGALHLAGAPHYPSPPPPGVLSEVRGSRAAVLPGGSVRVQRPRGRGGGGAQAGETRSRGCCFSDVSAVFLSFFHGLSGFRCRRLNWTKLPTPKPEPTLSMSSCAAENLGVAGFSQKHAPHLSLHPYFLFSRLTRLMHTAVCGIGLGFVKGECHTHTRCGAEAVEGWRVRGCVVLWLFVWRLRFNSRSLLFLPFSFFSSRAADAAADGPLFWR